MEEVEIEIKYTFNSLNNTRFTFISGLTPFVSCIEEVVSETLLKVYNLLTIS